MPRKHTPASPAARTAAGRGAANASHKSPAASTQPRKCQMYKSLLLSYRFVWNTTHSATAHTSAPPP